MKSLIFFLFLFLCIPLIPFAQKVITLSVNQPPEFGFSVSKLDTTIVKGRSVVLGTDLIVFGGSGEYEYNWSPTATLDDSTSINPLATPLDTTTYLLTVTDKFGCSFSVNYTVNARNPLVNSELISSLQTLQAVLFPNPNDGKFKVKLTGVPVDKIELTIFDNTGKVVKKQTINNFTGDHTEMLQLKLVSGVYTLHIDSGAETLSRQFIIN
jgi:hypothetical protein